MVDVSTATATITLPHGALAFSVDITFPRHFTLPCVFSSNIALSGEFTFPRHFHHLALTKYIPVGAVALLYAGRRLVTIVPAVGRLGVVSPTGRPREGWEAVIGTVVARV